MTGRLIAVVGPSGAGKDTLIRGALARDPTLSWARRSVTRPPSGSEPFESLDDGEFARRVAADQFALHWRAHGLRYGVAWAELEPMAAGGTVLFNGSRAALSVALAQFPALQVIEVTAPAELLALRLAERGRESAQEIAERIARSCADLPEGLPVRRVINDGSCAQGIALMLAALHPVRA